MNKKHTKKDEISEFCTLLIKVNKSTKGTYRLGQTIANAVRFYDGRTNCDPYYITNNDLINGLEKLYEETKHN